MKHKVKLTVIDKKLYPELQAKYCADPCAGACPCYNVGDEFIFVPNVQSDKIQSTKVLCNGQLYIRYNGTTYNVQGVKVK